MNQRIVCAAIRNKSGDIICGVRHQDAIMKAQIRRADPDLLKWRPHEIEEGFVDNKYTFLDRKAAYVVAIRENQIIYPIDGAEVEEKLWTEHLY